LAAAPILGFLLVALSPLAQASVIPTYDFHGDVPVFQVGNQGAENHLGIFAAATDVRGRAAGAFAFMDAHSAAGTEITRIEVLDKRQQSVWQNALQQYLQGQTVTYYVAAYDGATIDVAPGAT